MNRYKYSSDTYTKEGEWAIIQIPCDSCEGDGYEPMIRPIGTGVDPNPGGRELRRICSECGGHKYSNKYQYVRFDLE